MDKKHACGFGDTLTRRETQCAHIMAKILRMQDKDVNCLILFLRQHFDLQHLKHCLEKKTKNNLFEGPLTKHYDEEVLLSEEMILKKY